jgi:hypothetical protein
VLEEGVAECDVVGCGENTAAALGSVEAGVCTGEMDEDGVERVKRFVIVDFQLWPPVPLWEPDDIVRVGAGGGIGVPVSGIGVEDDAYELGNPSDEKNDLAVFTGGVATGSGVVAISDGVGGRGDSE